MEGPIVIAGAGSIGCFVGGLLSLAGQRVRFLARPAMVEEITRHGLRLSSLEGLDERIEPGRLRLFTDPAEALAGAALVLVTVKSGATAEMGALIAAHAPADATVVSLQNGLDNAATLRTAAPGHRVLAGMVPFNVVQLGRGRLHRGTSGSILIDEAPDIVARLDRPHLPVAGHDDMRAVLAGKLLLNLNNALNALSGLTLHEELADPGWRRLLAACQAEALRVFRRDGVEPWSMGPLPASWLPRILRLPTPLFRLAMRASVRIDRTARSSMSEDLARRRPTEIGELQGKVVALADRLGLPAPVNRSIMDAIIAAERVGAGSPSLRPADILRAAS